MSAWVNVVGIGDDGLAGLSPTARALVDGAEVLIGGERHLRMLPADGRRHLAWPKPFNPLIDEIKALHQQRVVVLASGDPCCHGVGSRLMQALGHETVRITPSPSAFSYACARLGWSLSEVETLSLHGRDLANVCFFLQPDARLLLLSENRETPLELQKLLVERGYSRSEITVLEHLGGAGERRVDVPAGGNADIEFADLNTVAVVCRRDPDTPLLPRVAGLADDVYEHDGQLTKREVRAVTLAKLMPTAAQTLWDVGAGCGSIGIEWLRGARASTVIAIEENPQRCAMLARNAGYLGVPHLQIIQAAAPQALSGLARPDAVFIGGGICIDGLFEACWEALQANGRLVANVVSVQGEQELYRWHAKLGGSLTRIAISRAMPVGRFEGWKPLMPVTQLCVHKPLGAD